MTKVFIIISFFIGIISTFATSIKPLWVENFDNKITGKVSKVDFVPGRNKKAALFTVNNHSSIKYSNYKIDLNKGTISLWVKPNLPLKSDNLRTILNIGGPAKELQGINFQIDKNSLSCAYLRIDNLNWKPNNWNHIAYTWEAIKGAKGEYPIVYKISLYVNGQGKASKVINMRPIPKGIITLGAYPVPEYGRPQLFELDGCLDDFAIYNKALNAKEIAQIYGSKDVVPASLEKNILPKNTGNKVNPFVPSNTTGQVILTKNTYIEIIIPAKPSKSEVASAYDLRSCLVSVTKGRVSVRKNKTINKGYRIYIGNTSNIKEKFAHDEIFISIDDEKAILTGHFESGPANAIYTLLEYAGFRWFDISKEGMYIPKGNQIILPKGKWRYTPFFSMRRIQLAAPYDYKAGIKASHLDEWGRRNRLDLGSYAQFHKMVAPHLDKIIPESLFSTHPEYFGMDDLQVRDVPSRNKINPCTSNPRVVELICKKAIELLKKNPNALYFSIEPIDGGGWCLCKNCKKLDYVPGNYTDRVMTLANQITLSLEKAFPNQGKAARFFAYQGYVNLPVKTKAVGNLQVEVTRGAPYLVTNWAKYVKNLQRWDYNGWFSFKWGVLPTFMLHEKIRLAKENHYTGGYFDEGVASALTLGQPFYYLESKLMWNPNFNVETILADFFSKYYGKASIVMRKAFNLIEQATLENKTSEDFFTEYNRAIFQPYIYSPSMWDKCIALCEEAKTLEKNNPIIVNRIETTLMTYLFSSIASDALIAKQYLQEKNHPFNSYIIAKRAINTQRLLTAIKIAKKLGFQQVRGNNEPGNLEAIIAAYAHLLKIDITPFYEIFYPNDKPTKLANNENKPWKLVFKDNFNRKNIGDNWKIIHGNWKIENNALSGRGDAIYINKKFPGDQKLVFSAWVDKSKAACDLDGILGDKSMAKYGNNGYLFAFGTYGNNFSKINREKVQVVKIAKPIIEPGKHHKIVCEKNGNKLIWYVDGKKIVEYQETFKVLNGPYIGFYTDAGGFFDNIEVYTK